MRDKVPRASQLAAPIGSGDRNSFYSAYIKLYLASHLALWVIRRARYIIWMSSPRLWLPAYMA